MISNSTTEARKHKIRVNGTEYPLNCKLVREVPDPEQDYRLCRFECEPALLPLSSVKDLTLKLKLRE